MGMISTKTIRAVLVLLSPVTPEIRLDATEDKVVADSHEVDAWIRQTQTANGFTDAPL